MVHEALAPKLSSGHIDGDRKQRKARILPRLGLPTGFVDDPATDGDDKAAVLSGGHELSRVEQSAVRMAPANERLDPDGEASFQMHLRLIEQLEFSPVERVV